MTRRIGGWVLMYGALALFVAARRAENIQLVYGRIPCHFTCDTPMCCCRRRGMCGTYTPGFPVTWWFGTLATRPFHAFPSFPIDPRRLGRRPKPSPALHPGHSQPSLSSLASPRGTRRKASARFLHRCPVRGGEAIGGQGRRQPVRVARLPNIAATDTNNTRSPE